MEKLTYSDGLHGHNLFSFEGWLLRLDLVLVWKRIHGHRGINPETLFTFIRDTASGSQPYELYVQRTNLEVHRRFFSLRIVNVWNSFTPDTFFAESLDTFERLFRRDLREQLFEFC